MLLPVVVCLIGLLVVALALGCDEPLRPRTPRAPDWQAPPSPADVAAADFPLAVPGYDPASVEAHLRAVGRVYGDLLAATATDATESPQGDRDDAAASPVDGDRHDRP